MQCSAEYITRNICLQAYLNSFTISLYLCILWCFNDWFYVWFSNLWTLDLRYECCSSSCDQNGHLRGGQSLSHLRGIQVIGVMVLNTHSEFAHDYSWICSVFIDAEQWKWMLPCRVTKAWWMEETTSSWPTGTVWPTSSSRWVKTFRYICINPIDNKDGLFPISLTCKNKSYSEKCLRALCPICSFLVLVLGCCFFLHDLIRISLNSFVSCLPASNTGGNLVRALIE